MADTNTQQEPRAPDDGEKDSNIVKKILAEKITYYRKLKRLSRAALAEKIGVSEAAVGQYERGERLPSIETLIDLSKVFELPVDALVSDYDDKFWSSVRLVEKVGFFVELGRTGQVTVFARTIQPAKFYDNKLAIQFDNGDEQILEYPVREHELVALFENHYDFAASVEAFSEVLCHAVGARYYANKFFLEIMAKGMVGIPELILIERKDIMKNYYSQIKSPKPFGSAYFLKFNDSNGFYD